MRGRLRSASPCASAQRRPQASRCGSAARGRALPPPLLSPLPIVLLQGGLAAEDDAKLADAIAERDAHNKAVVLEMVGDLPSADVAPPENVLFVCKLNKVTRDADLELIFSRFGDIVSCDIIRDEATGESLNYGFVAFKERQ